MTKLLLKLLTLALALTGLSSAAAPRPNVIFILTDDMGWGDLGVFFQNSRTSAQKFVTPNLDTFANEGIQLRRHYCPAPVCAPSRASLVLGVHQGHANVRDNQFDKELENNHTLGTVMRQAGYSTACIGKWGLQGGSGFPGHPQNRGFDYFFGYISHAEAHKHYPKEGSVTYYDGFSNISNQLDKCYSTDLATARAKKWIVDQHTADPAKPFFLYLTYNAPHAQLQVPTSAYPAGKGLNGGLQWTGTSGSMINTATGTTDSWIHPDYASTGWPAYAQRHATMIRRLDDAVSDLVQLLKDLNIDENTLIVFTSDNGTHNEAGTDGVYAYIPTYFDTFGPFEGIKRDVLEGGIRMPALVRWPAHIPAGQITESPSQFHDWMPTFAEVAGLPKPSRSDGVSLVPSLTGTGIQKPSDIYIEYSVGGSTPSYAEFANHKNETRSQMQVVYLGKYKGMRTNIGSHATNFRIYDTQVDVAESTDLNGQPGVPTQQQFKDRALQLRRVGGGVTRPYDTEAVPAVTPTGVVNGLKYRTYEKNTPWVPDWRTETSSTDGTTTIPDLTLRTRANDIGLSFQGYLKVPAEGDYTFYLTTDTGAFVHLHDTQLLDADFGYSAGTEKNSGTIKLKAGYHPIRIDYRHASAVNSTLNLQWSGPGLAKQVIPASAYFIDGAGLPGAVPQAMSDHATTTQNAAVIVPVLSNDSDDGLPQALTITGVTAPAAGTAVINGTNIIYTPKSGFLGNDSFTYTISDGEETANASVNVSVTYQDTDYWFPLNQSSGFTTWEAGGARQATLQGFSSDTAPWVSGRLGGHALQLDGGNDKVVITGFHGIAGTGARTVSAWVKTTAATAGDKPIACWGATTTGNKWIFLMNSAGRLRVEVEGGYVVGTRLLNDGQWHHVACTFSNDGTPNATDIKLYVDGALETLTVSQGVTINTTTPSAVQIGADVQERYWNGTLSDVRILPRALNATQITALFNEKTTAALSWWKRYYGANSVSWTTDTDGDGLNAIQEFAFGRQPHIAEKGAASALIGEIPDAAFDFLRRAAVEGGVIYEVAASEDLQNWTLPVTLLESVPEMLSGESMERVSYTVANPGDYSRLFYRVTVRLP